MNLANEYRKFLNLEKNVLPENKTLDIIEWIENSIDKNWSFIQNLKYKIGVHQGSIPRHINSSIIEYFNDAKLNVIFCTDTIIEGVNTNSKNIIYFDSKKVTRNIDYFDYSNIKGHAGRMMEHLIGKVYNFNEPPKKEHIYIDIPFFEQNPISNEILINIKEKDVKNKESEEYKYLNSIPKGLKSIIQKNSMLVDGQLKIINEFEKTLIIYTI